MKRLTLILTALSALLLSSLNLSAQIPEGFDWACGTWCLDLPDGNAIHIKLAKDFVQHDLLALDEHVDVPPLSYAPKYPCHPLDTAYYETYGFANVRDTVQLEEGTYYNFNGTVDAAPVVVKNSPMPIFINIYSEAGSEGYFGETGTFICLNPEDQSVFVPEWNSNDERIPLSRYVEEDYIIDGYKSMLSDSEFWGDWQDVATDDTLTLSRSAKKYFLSGDGVNLVDYSDEQGFINVYTLHDDGTLSLFRDEYVDTVEKTFKRPEVIAAERQAEAERLAQEKKERIIKLSVAGAVALAVLVTLIVLLVKLIKRMVRKAKERAQRRAEERARRREEAAAARANGEETAAPKNRKGCLVLSIILAVIGIGGYILGNVDFGGSSGGSYGGSSSGSGVSSGSDAAARRYNENLAGTWSGSTYDGVMTVKFTPSSAIGGSYTLMASMNTFGPTYNELQMGSYEIVGNKVRCRDTDGYSSYFDFDGYTLSCDGVTFHRK